MARGQHHSIGAVRRSPSAVADDKATMSSDRARQSCWTCKERKIGCDRTYPLCNNCTRSGRQCQGYNLRLLWPDRPDGRRKIGEVFHSPIRPGSEEPLPRFYGTQFLNVTSDDIVVSNSDLDPSRIVSRPTLPGPRKSLNLHHAFMGQEAVLISYYERKISSMISTTQVPNGFRSELLPMALSDRDRSSMALCNAMLAVSAQHHHGSEAALPYKTNAVRSLYDSLRLGDGAADDGRSILNVKDGDIIDTQIAASMMLCVYSVFDASEGNWHMHLDGARYMLQRLLANHKGRVQSSFLLTWFLYHEVLACFTHPFREKPQELDLLQLLEDARIDKTIIVGSLGCSAEVIEIIHRINRIRTSPLLDGEADTRCHNELAAQRLMLEHRLNTLTQEIHPEEEESITPFRRLRVLSTADLYRLAASLYLFRVLPLHDDDMVRPVILSSALGTLDRLDVATSPWPLFIIACEAVDDDARLQVLRVLERMELERGIGNVRVMRGIVEAFWKQQDLKADTAGHSAGQTAKSPQGHAPALRWGDLINCDPPVPWFI